MPAAAMRSKRKDSRCALNRVKAGKGSRCALNRVRGFRRAQELKQLQGQVIGQQNTTIRAALLEAGNYMQHAPKW